MRRWVVGAVAALVVAGGALPAAGSSDLLIVDHQRLTERLHEYTVRSAALERDVPVRVHLPSGYETDPGRRWPMALLLHGRSENATTWSERVDLDQFDDMIFVMPDGGLVGFYTDWVDDSCCDPQRWETFHIDEVLPWAEQEFRLAPGRSQRFVAGVSMGGYGTMHYAARYPDRFGGAAELSGFVDLMTAEVSGVIGVDGQSFQVYQIPPGSIMGDRIEDEVHWRGHNPVDLAANLFATDLVLRHGNGLPGEYGGNPDPGEAAIRQTGVSFHERLDELGIDHLWDDYGNGTHIWPYWEDGLQIAMPRWLEIAADAPADPVPFSYTTIEPAFSVYGFDVTIERDVREFATLTDVQTSGFTVTGSGTATVVTAAWYHAGGSYAVAVGDDVRTLQADADGRLTVAVDLGPSHTADQFSPQARLEEAAAGDAYFATAQVTIVEQAEGPGSGDDGAGAAPGGPDGAMPDTGGAAARWALAALLLAGVLSGRAGGPAGAMRSPT